METNEEIKRIFEKADDPSSFIDRLKKLKENFELSNKFKVGDIVIWKDGLKNRNIPEYDSPGIVMRLLEPAVVDDTREPSSPYYGEPLDISVGFISVDNEFIIFAQDSRRFRHYPF
jgi:uncharacterized protein YkvS